MPETATEAVKMHLEHCKRFRENKFQNIEKRGCKWFEKGVRYIS